MEEVIYEAKGRFATLLDVPMLACRKCGWVTYPKGGQTSIVCRCGKVYTLQAEGRPVRAIPLKQR